MASKIALYPVTHSESFDTNGNSLTDVSFHLITLINVAVSPNRRTDKKYCESKLRCSISIVKPTTIW